MARSYTRERVCEAADELLDAWCGWRELLGPLIASRQRRGVRRLVKLLLPIARHERRAHRQLETLLSSGRLAPA